MILIHRQYGMKSTVNIASYSNDEQLKCLLHLFKYRIKPTFSTQPLFERYINWRLDTGTNCGFIASKQHATRIRIVKSKEFRKQWTPRSLLHETINGHSAGCSTARKSSDQSVVVYSLMGAFSPPDRGCRRASPSKFLALYGTHMPLQFLFKLAQATSMRHERQMISEISHLQHRWKGAFKPSNATPPQMQKPPISKRAR